MYYFIGGIGLLLIPMAIVGALGLMFRRTINDLIVRAEQTEAAREASVAELESRLELIDKRLLEVESAAIKKQEAIAGLAGQIEMLGGMLGRIEATLEHD